MKFSGYQSNLKLQDGTPRVAVSANPLAYGMGGRGLEGLARGMDKVEAVVEKKQQEDDTQDLLDARNKIMNSLTQQLYNSETGLMTIGVGENAKGLSQRVADAVKTTTDDVLKDYNGRVQQAARRTLRENLGGFERMAANRESSEAVKMKGVRYENNLQSAGQLCGLNYNNDEIIKAQLATGRQLTQAYGLDFGLPGSSIAAKERDMVTSYISSAVNAAVQAGDYVRAEALLKEHKAEMDINKWLPLSEQVKQKALNKGTYAKAESIYKASGGNLNVAYEMAKAECTTGGSSGSYVPVSELANLVTTNDNDEIVLGDLTKNTQSRLAAAAKEIKDTLGFNLNVTSAANGTHDENSWHYSGQAVDIASDNLYDAGLRGQVQEILEKHGLSVYDEYVNRSENWSGDHLHVANKSADEEQDSEYGSPASAGAVDYEKLERLKRRIDGFYSDDKRAEQQQKAQRAEYIQDLVEGAGSYTDALTAIEESGLDGLEAKKAENMAKRLYGAGSTGSSKAPNETYLIGGGIIGARKYTEANVERDADTIEKFRDQMVNDDALNYNSWHNAAKAAQRLRATGRIDNGTLEEIAYFTGDPEYYSKITSSLASQGVRETMLNMMEAGVSREAATFMILEVDPSFYDKRTKSEIATDKWLAENAEE